jgi:peroxiredoxin
MLGIAALLSSASLLKLVHVNRTLVKERNAAIARGLEWHRGQFVPVFHGSDGCGQELQGGLPTGQKQVIVVFTTTCPYCLQMLHGWSDLARFARENGSDLLGVSLDSARLTKSYVHTRAAISVACLLDTRTRRLMKVSSGVPQTVVIDSTGRVLFARVGLIGKPAWIPRVWLCWNACDRPPRNHPCKEIAMTRVRSIWVHIVAAVSLLTVAVAVTTGFKPIPFCEGEGRTHLPKCGTAAIPDSAACDEWCAGQAQADGVCINYTSPDESCCVCF